MKKNLLKMAVLGASTAIALTACGLEAKDELYKAESNYTVAYTIGSAEDFSVMEEMGIGTEKAVFDDIVDTYSTNMFGNFGGMLLNGEKTASGTYKGKEITPYFLCMSKKSRFEEVEEGYVDPMNARAYYTREKDGAIKLYTNIITEDLKIEYIDYVWGANSFTYVNGQSVSVNERVTDKSIKIEKGVMTAVFSVDLFTNGTQTVAATFSTTWNLEK